MKIDFSTKHKTADTLQMLQVSVNALRRGSITDEGKEFLCLAVEDYIQLKNSQTGRTPVYKTEEDRLAARRETYRKANAKRRYK